ncbi:MAG: helical backbone metal receptor [Saprospiraceae bacterium]|nr:helical backbone metal receptor [Saprospiraceae bacterium]
MRIVSLVPSLTELLFDLGLHHNIIGRTKFCIHPSDQVQSVAKIGGTKKVDIELTRSLQPDLVIANKEENTRSDVEALRTFTKVLVTDIFDFHSAIQAMETIGKLTDTESKAKTIIDQINLAFKDIKQRNTTKKSVCYLIWNDPIMSIGRDTFIHDMLHKCGYINVFEKQTRYPTISEDLLIKKNPDCIFLSSEPFPFKQKHIQKYREICPSSKIVIVDGEYFSWYGSRMLKAVSYFNELIDSV